MPIAVLSPHLDDAVLSCWHVLEGQADVRVINVFAGSPPAGTPTPPWDRLTGARDPVTRMGERRAEDRVALRRAGIEPVNLRLLDAQYREGRPVADDLADTLQGHVPPGVVLQAPAGLSGHPDHALVRDAAIALARRGWPLVIYADLPHGIIGGWPAWVAGSTDAGAAGVGAAWDAVLAAAGLNVMRLVPCVRALDAATRGRKLRALDDYRTQRAALDRLAFVPLDDPRALAFEVAWRVPQSALDAQESGREVRVADAVGESLDEGG